MKKLLILALVAICGFAWRSESIVHALGLGTRQAGQPAPLTIEALTENGGGKPQGMSVHEYAELAKNDPNAYQKFIQSHQKDEKRGELDKLMNFFSRGKYE